MNNKKVIWEPAPDISSRLPDLITKTELTWIKPDQIVCMRSTNATAKAYARIWGLAQIWQLALNEKPYYVIEVLSHHFDKLPTQKQNHILLHELAHIPKNFSGAILPHSRRGKGSFHDKLKKMIAAYESSTNSRR